MSVKTIWIEPSEVPTKIRTTIYKGLTDLEATLLYNRQIDTIKKLDFFFSDELNRIPDWSKLYGAKLAAQKIIDAVKSSKKIFIHGDYDADGICASALLWEYMYRDLAVKLNVKPDITPYIPDRIDEGYGLSEKSIKKLLDQGAQLIITVDCGVRDRAIIEKYTKKGLEFIITDHHQPPDDITKERNYTLVHQLYPNKKYPYNEITGTFVIFLVIQAIRHLIGEDDKITSDTQGIDLVAITTITDIMPLTFANRIMVKNGLAQLTNSPRLGLSKLIKVAGLEFRQLTAYDIGFIIGPRINATGRIGQAMDALKLLVTQNSDFASKTAQKLNELNTKRQEMTETIMQKINSKIEQTFKDDKKSPKAVFEIENNLPEGIIGLVAGKLQEKYNRPVIIASRKLSSEGDIEEVRGSARSISGFNITEAIEKFAPFLIKYGGHAQAAGFTCKIGKEDQFRKNFLQLANDEITDKMLVKKIKISAQINSDEIDNETITMIRKLEPYGYGNPKPIFIIKGLIVVDHTYYEAKHFLKIKAKGQGIDLLDLLVFRYDLTQDDPKAIKKDQVIDVIGTPDINEWKGYVTPQFIVTDWRVCYNTNSN